MPINDDLQRAVERAVTELGQPKQVAQRMIAWLNELSQSDLSKSDNSKHLSTVRDAVTTTTGGEASDED